MRIPASLWTSAVKAADRYGLNPTVRALGLDYKSLQRHVAAAGGRSGAQIGNARLGREAPTTFVELAAPVVSGGLAECVVELEPAGGAKMRIHLQGVAVADLAALIHSVWDRHA